MKKIKCFLYKILHKIYSKIFRRSIKILPHEMDVNKVSNLIFERLKADDPFMVARFGSTELNIVTNYLFVKKRKHRLLDYIKGNAEEFWWNKKMMRQMETLSGFFPANEEYLSRFSELMIEDMRCVDVLGSWRKEELYFSDELKNSFKADILRLEPWWSDSPWTEALEGKHILVVHPFSDDIINQYTKNRDKLWNDKRILPRFASLRVVKAVQSLGGASNNFSDWFEALEWMKKEMDKEPYDISLIGCGAYGFPLSAYSKRTGHKAIHLGGVLQLLFGIKGKRWDNPNYHEYFNYQNLFNEYWIYPSNHNVPTNAHNVEGGCYWS